MPVSSANKMQKYATALSNTSRTLLGKNLSRALSNRSRSFHTLFSQYIDILLHFIIYDPSPYI